MLRSNLKNKAYKSKTIADIAVYKKQRNYIIRLNKETMHNHFNSLDLDTKKGLKPFRIVYKPYFSNINTEIVWSWLKKITNL